VVEAAGRGVFELAAIAAGSSCYNVNMQKMIVANWKENPQTEAATLKLFNEIARAAAKPAKQANIEVVICPPAVYLEEIAAAYRKMSAPSKKNLAIGAQDVFWEEHGAFTGEVGPKMLKSLGVRYVIIGHSERRRYAKETDAMINAKIKSSLNDGLKIILCVGEPIAIRKKGIAAAHAFIKNQLKKDLAGIGVGTRQKLNSVTIAYEPIWAIGSGRSDSPEDARAMAKFIKSVVGKARFSRFLYGGSVNGKNAGDYIQYKGIDGALVGGASLKAGEFGKIIKAAKGSDDK
jgi:triosephosphate isomerase (TIM)